MSDNDGNPSYGTVNREYGMQLAMTPPDEDGPVWMVNLMKYHEVADYGASADGQPSKPISGLKRWSPSISRWCLEKTITTDTATSRALMPLEQTTLINARG